MINELVIERTQGVDSSMWKKPIITLKNVLPIAGAYLAFVIGAGIASGQEILQYFTAYGYGSFLALLLYFILAVLMNTEFIRTGQREKFKGQDGIYKYYCGKWLGTFYDYFAHIFLFSSFIVMLSGSGATLNQHFGIPTSVGVWGTAIASGLAVTMGLKKISAILGKVGPALISIMIAICIISIFTGPLSIKEGIDLMSDLDIISSSSTWYISAINYIGFSIFWSAPFLSTFGKTLGNQKQAVVGQTLGEFLFSLTTLIVIIAMLTNMTLMENTQIPTLALGSAVHPLFGNVFSVIITVAIFSTTVPLLSLSANRFINEKTSKGKITMMAMALVAAVFALVFPFDRLMNYIYVANGYIGLVFLIFVFIKAMRRTMNNKRQSNEIHVYENAK